MAQIIRFLSRTAAEQYDLIDFNTESLFNEEAPDPSVAFGIGGVLSAMGFVMWIRRLQFVKMKMAERGISVEWNVLLRALISSATDSDEPLYTTVSFGAASFLFLGGLQINFPWTLLVMLSTYALSAMTETARILIAFVYTPSLKTLVETSDIVASQMRSLKAELTPSNVYEDLGRGKTIVLMVFITQVILIGFVCIDLYRNDVVNCLDGTKECPVVGTLGSWWLYVLGIFMACVFQLGPKTKYGESEQNPAYWLQLLLTTKEDGVKVTWYDPVKDQKKERLLTMRDPRIWVRLFMSFLINGVGYHILVHALPVQVAQQSTLTGVVVRAVGMMYLVDMDDTPGYKLTIMLKNDESIEKKVDDPKAHEPKKEDHHSAPGPKTHGASTDEFDQAAQKIIEEAKQKLEALARGENPAIIQQKKDPTNPRARNLLMGVVHVVNTTKVRQDETRPGTLTVPNGDVEKTVEEEILFVDPPNPFVPYEDATDAQAKAEEEAEREAEMEAEREAEAERDANIQTEVGEVFRRM